MNRNTFKKKVVKIKKENCPATHHADATGKRKCCSYYLLTSALDGVERSASRPGRALPLTKDPRHPFDRRLWTENWNRSIPQIIRLIMQNLKEMFRSSEVLLFWLVMLSAYNCAFRFWFPVSNLRCVDTFLTVTFTTYRDVLLVRKERGQKANDKTCNNVSVGTNALSTSEHKITKALSSKFGNNVADFLIGVKHRY
jgi:hypothetical protein